MHAYNCNDMQFLLEICTKDIVWTQPFASKLIVKLHPILFSLYTTNIISNIIYLNSIFDNESVPSYRNIHGCMYLLMLACIF